MLYDIIKAALVIAPSKDVRLALNGVHVKRQGDETVFTATDGHAVLIARASRDLGFPDNFDAVLDRFTLADVVKVRKRSDVTVAAAEVTEEGAILLGGMRVPSLVDAAFPNVEGLLRSAAKGRGMRAGVNFKLLERVAKAGLAIAPGEKHPFGVLQCSDGKAPIEFTVTLEGIEVTILQAPARV